MSGHRAAHPPPFLMEDEFPTYEKELTPLGLMTAWFTFWHKVPRRIWQFHIECLLIPAYRAAEWGKYKDWSYRSALKKLVSKDEKKFTRALKLKRRRESAEEKQARIDNEHLLGHSDGCRKLTFNISGVRFETQVRTVLEFPDSVLGDPMKRRRFYVPERDEYFFDRHALSFEAILHFYQTKGTVLNRPSGVPLPVFEEEMTFYQVDPDILERLRVEEGFYKEKPKSTPRSLFARKVWLLFEYPDSSSQARIVAIISIFVVTTSIFILCLETLGDYKLHEHELFSPRDSFFLTETVAIVWFTIELAARFLACHHKVRFLKEFMNIVDFIAILPYFIQLVTEVADSREIVATDQFGAPVEAQRKRQSATVSLLRIIRLARVLRIFKLSRHAKGLKILGLTLQASLRELGLLLFFLGVGVILFASGVYYAETSGDASQFPSIPDGFFWAFTTMTTLGYGDVVPVTFFGKIVGSACAVAGVLTLSLPVPVIVSNFNYFSHRDIDQEDIQESKVAGKHVDDCPYLPDCEEYRKHQPGQTTDEEDMLIQARNAPFYIPKFGEKDMNDTDMHLSL